MSGKYRTSSAGELVVTQKLNEAQRRIAAKDRKIAELEAVIRELRVAPEHPEDRCDRCGGPNPVWSAPNELWNEVVGSPNGILCPDCFAKAIAREDPDQQEGTDKKKRVRVYCSQFAQCKWRGYRQSDRLGPQPDPCPRCGGEVVR